MSDITSKLRDLSRWLRRLANHEAEPECKASHIECADDCSEAADEIETMRAEIADLKDRMACLKEFRMDGLGVGMIWSGDAANALMQMLAATMIDVPNYLESTLTIAGHGESYVMTIRRHGGKTPHAMRAEAEAEIARLREALETLTLVVGLTAFKHEGQRAPLQEAMDQARAALATAEGVGNG